MLPWPPQMQACFARPVRYPFIGVSGGRVYGSTFPESSHECQSAEPWRRVLQPSCDVADFGMFHHEAGCDVPRCGNAAASGPAPCDRRGFLDSRDGSASSGKTRTNSASPGDTQRGPAEQFCDVRGTHKHSAHRFRGHPVPSAGAPSRIARRDVRALSGNAPSVRARAADVKGDEAPALLSRAGQLGRAGDAADRQENPD